MEVLTKSAAETKELGREMAANLATSDKRQAKRGTIVALTGDLGSGKTTFVQGFAEGLGIKHRIISPTFIIVRQYQIPKTRYQIRSLYHLDLYRLETEKEMGSLGVEEIWNDPDNFVAIEWAEKIKEMVPKEAAWIRFEIAGEDKRRMIY